MSKFAYDGPYQKELKQLGQQIKKLRTDRKLTQEDLADLAHINTSYLAKIEGGYVNTSVRYIIKIAKALKVATKSLFE